MKLKKVVLLCIAGIAAVYAVIVLYSHQLGAIAFFLISIYLFYFAIKELLKQKKNKNYDNPRK